MVDTEHLFELAYVLCFVLLLNTNQVLIVVLCYYDFFEILHLEACGENGGGEMGRQTSSFTKGSLELDYVSFLLFFFFFFSLACDFTTTFVVDKSDDIIEQEPKL